MTINLYINKSEKERVTKTLSSEKSFTGTLREQTSIIDPVINIETTENISGYNYMYIPEFGRYYYIRGIDSVKGNLWRVSGHVDVLMSFKSQILENSGVIERQENNWNLYLPDPNFQTENRTQIQTKTFPHGFNNKSYILVISGNNPIA